jgi:outer membrane lipoprotein LolB
VRHSAARRLALVHLLATPFLIAACASNTRTSGTFPLKSTSTEPADFISRFAGRISLVFDDPEQGSPSSFSGAFELRGHARTGELDLLTPLGSIAAQLKWQPGQALLIQAGQTRNFASADELISQATGTTISAQQLFDWMQGKSNATSASSSSDWLVDLSRYVDGRITAKRTGQQAATLRIILEQP